MSQVSDEAVDAYLNGDNDVGTAHRALRSAIADAISNKNSESIGARSAAANELAAAIGRDTVTGGRRRRHHNTKRKRHTKH